MQDRANVPDLGRARLLLAQYEIIIVLKKMYISLGYVYFQIMFTYFHSYPS